MRLAARIVTAITPPLLAAILLLGAWGLPARAQPAPPSPPPVSVASPLVATLAVTGASARVALPAVITSFPVVLLVNDGAAEIFIAIGGNAVTAATTNFAIPSGQSAAFFLVSGSTSVAAITSTGTSTLRVSQWTGAPWFVGGGTAGGGSVAISNFPTTGSSIGNPVYEVTSCNGVQQANSAPCPIAAVDGTQVAISITSGPAAQTAVDTSTMGIASVILDFSAVGSGNTTGFQTSSDNANWHTPVCYRDDNTLQGSIAGTNQYQCALNRFFRLNNTVFSTGPITGTMTFKGGSIQPFGPGVYLRSQYPVGGTATSNPITTSNTATTGAITATLAATSGKTTYICGYNITADATAAAVGNGTITGTITGTLNFRQNVGAVAAGTAINKDSFNPCIPASAANTPIVVNAIAAGTSGNTNIYAYGYQQ